MRCLFKPQHIEQRGFVDLNQALINQKAKAANQDLDFARRIRKGVAA
jgi:hypothetical protein